MNETKTDKRISYLIVVVLITSIKVWFILVVFNDNFVDVNVRAGDVSFKTSWVKTCVAVSVLVEKLVVVKIFSDTKLLLVSAVVSLMLVEVVVEVATVDPVDLFALVPDVDVLIELEEVVVVPIIFELNVALVLVGFKLVLFEVLIKDERKAVVFVVVSSDFVVAFVLVVNEIWLHLNEFA